MNASEYYQAGQLDEATAAATDDVKRHPTDVSRRGLLAELLCFAHQWQRADVQLEALAQQDTKAALVVALLRQLIRAEQARQQFFHEGRLPEFLEPPPEHLKLHLEASIRDREGAAAEAAALLARAEAVRPPLTGVCNGERFEGLRDLDDLLSPLFEVLTSTGKYYWIPMERVESVEFFPPERPRDLLWRRAHMIVRGGPDGEVFLPALYPGANAEPDGLLRLGRRTEWRGGEGTPVRGAGQRVFLAGETDRAIMELQEIVMDHPLAGAEHGETAS
jgi:type VI secretion system protein ImpE